MRSRLVREPGFHLDLSGGVGVNALQHLHLGITGQGSGDIILGRKPALDIVELGINIVDQVNQAFGQNRLGIAGTDLYFATVRKNISLGNQIAELGFNVSAPFAVLIPSDCQDCAEGGCQRPLIGASQVLICSH